MYCENFNCAFWTDSECNFAECVCEEIDEYEGIGGC